MSNILPSTVSYIVNDTSGKSTRVGRYILLPYWSIGIVVVLIAIGDTAFATWEKDVTSDVFPSDTGLYSINHRSESLGALSVIAEPCSPPNPNLCFALELSANTLLGSTSLSLRIHFLPTEITPVY